MISESKKAIRTVCERKPCAEPLWDCLYAQLGLKRPVPYYLNVVENVTRIEGSHERLPLVLFIDVAACETLQ